MPLIIIHFSQDFRSDKPQLGGYSRIYNICRDNNLHYIFTLSFIEKSIKVHELADNILVVEIPFNKDNFRLRNQIIGISSISKSILYYIKEKKIKADLFFGHSQLINFFILNSVRKDINKNIPFVWEMNAIWGYRETKSYKDKFMLSLLRVVQAHVLRKSTSIILHSNESKKFVSKIYDKEFKKLSVITNAVNSEEIIEENMIHTSNKPVKFVCIGFFDEMNGIPMLVRYLKNRAAQIDISFYGSGQFEKDVIDLGNEGKLHFGGILKRNEMIQKLRDFDFIIIPRLPHREADLFIPTKLLEAMANGVIPICSDVKGMTEVVENNVNGIVFKAGNLKAFDDSIDIALTLPPETVIAMKQKARETVLNLYNWENNHNVLNSLYQSLLNHRK